MSTDSGAPSPDPDGELISAVATAMIAAEIDAVTEGRSWSKVGLQEHFEALAKAAVETVRAHDWGPRPSAS